MDGLLIIDKPAGPTSHDVVARIRRALGEKRIGHTGTLDPAATGLLPLVLGRATRLAQFLSASDKSYDAVIRLGFSTDTGDAHGRPIEPSYRAALPSCDAIEAALEQFRGTFLQQPPAFSAKMIGGQRSYALARARSKRHPMSDTVAVSARIGPPVLPAPTTVTAHTMEMVSVEGDRVTLRVECSAGFYIRSLAHDLGRCLGCGGHLASLRRTRSGDFTLTGAIDLDRAVRDPQCAVAAVIPMAGMLPGRASVVLNAEGVRHARHGRELGPGDGSGFGAWPSGFRAADGSRIPNLESRRSVVRLLDLAGDLVGIAEPSTIDGLLHPSIVLV